jgi:hypothetical protein
MHGRDDAAVGISIAEANVLNHFSIMAVGAWAADADGFKKLVGGPPAPHEQPFGEHALYKFLRSELSLLTMQQLVLSYLVNPERGVETLTQNELADLIGLTQDLSKPVRRKRQDSNRKRLGEWILPALSQAQLVDGFERKARGDYSPHRIRISEKGVKLILWHYQKLKGLASPLFDEWNALTKPK